MGNVFEGRIIVNFGRHMTVETAAGNRVKCRIKGRSLRPVCGDLVSVEPSPDSTGLITSIHKRDSLLVRHDPRLGQQPLAANVDRMIVVVAPKPTLDPAMIDRYLAAAAILGIPALILLNKIDLLDTTRIVACREALDEYAAIGYSILETSAASGKGIDTLNESLRGHIGVLVGQSGTGKSSLLKALIPDAEIRIGEISHATEEGRHTTTVSVLYHLVGSGDLIDSPGVRGFQLWPIPAQELAHGFVEFQPHLGRCKFSDCSHQHEPGCSVIAAVESSSISRRRYESYRTLCAKNPD
ncbi:MAG TPA: ribosome small subunit-dependent GTPase A [Gammaproteobacteria bacterium]|nr:ribosome small subunit-dependent GTPase A [Gammaproteobacteria bacterium]